MNKTLEDLRKEIDSIDDELLKIISKRMDIVQEIGKIKKEQNIDVLDEQRWQQVINRIKNAAKNHNVSEDLIHKIYEEIHRAALEIEKL